MLKELKFLGYFLTIFLSLFFVVRFYLSDDNEMMYQYQAELEKKFENLPIIKNDTRNIIEYKNDVDEFINKEKKEWWILIK